MNKRLFYLDWLRFFVVLIPFHGAVSFTGGGDVYVYHPEILPFYTGQTDVPAFQVLSLAWSSLFQLFHTSDMLIYLIFRAISFSFF